MPKPQKVESISVKGITLCRARAAEILFEKDPIPRFKVKSTILIVSYASPAQSL
jgi:hypothetical protein